MSSHQSLVSLGQQIANLKFASIGPQAGERGSLEEMLEKVVTNLTKYVISEGKQANLRSSRAIKDIITYAYKYYLQEDFIPSDKEGVIDEQVEAVKRVFASLKSTDEEEVRKWIKTKISFDGEDKPSSEFLNFAYGHFGPVFDGESYYSGYVFDDLRKTSMGAIARVNKPVKTSSPFLRRDGFIYDYRMKNKTFEDLRKEILESFGTFLRENHPDKLFLVDTMCFVPQYRQGIDFNGEYENVINFKDMVYEAFPEYRAYLVNPGSSREKGDIHQLFNLSDQYARGDLVRRGFLNKRQGKLQFFTKEQIDKGDLESSYGNEANEIYFVNTHAGIETLNEFLRTQKRLHEILYTNHLKDNPNPQRKPQFDRKYKLL